MAGTIPTTNVGDALRRSAVLTASEVVAIAIAVCRRAEAEPDAVIPGRADDIAIARDGALLVHTSGEVDSLSASVASLLESLFPAEASAPVSPALRSLPARLRSSRSAPESEVKDLLAILRWHLREDPEPILRRLGQRLASTTAAIGKSAAVVNAAPAVETAPVESAPKPEPPAKPSVPPAPLDLPLQTIEPVAVQVTAPARQPLSRRAIIGAVPALIALAGYAGYRMTAVRMPGRDAVASGNVTPPKPPAAIPAAPHAPDETIERPHAEPLRLNVAGGAFSPAFSADGAALLFHAGRDQGRLLETSLTPARDFPIRSLLADPAHNFHPRPSPDGRWLAFDSDRSGTRAVYMMAANGGQLQNVSGDGFAAVPSWSPDMQRLAFVRGEAGRQSVWNVWVRHLPSGTLKRVSNFRSGQTWTASWFPDSRTICYSHDDQLIVVDVETGADRIFPSPVHGRLARTPAVSPDGSRIVFQVLGNGIWVLDVNSHQMHQVADDGTAEEFAWDPHGRRIAYHSHRDGEWRIWIMTV